MSVGGNRRFRCLSCHVEIRQRLNARRGLHSTLLAAGQGDDTCYKCHSEHNGQDFVPIRWEAGIEEFDHRKSGYPLEGGHAGLACGRCHNARRISPETRSGIRVKDLNRTFLGLSRECLGCHEDEHAGQVASKCDRCHTFASWKDVSRFNHASAKFSLSGAHQKVACQKCHPRFQSASRVTPRTRLASIAFGKCNDCHQDPHHGSFSATCTSCHSDSAWKPARIATAAWNHAQTKFPLLGKHIGLPCAKCHASSDFSAPMPHARCKDCHKDYHNGQFAARVDGGGCDACHTVEGWKPSTFSVASHSKAAYPLSGRHASVACAGCHKPAGSQTLYRLPHDQCTDCHADQHEGQFAVAGKNRCEACHTTQSYLPSTFDLSRHSQTRFPLEGSHLAVACGECHQKSPDHRAGVYRFAELACASCHQDPHQWRKPGQNPAMFAGGGLRCETCHNVQDWSEVSRFDHSTTRFALTGSHRAVACAECHRPAAPFARAAKIVFHDTPLACAGCHQDVHGGQFSSEAGPASCDGCHGTDKWRPSRFDHEKTDFPLKDGHAGVACGGCHKITKEVDGRMVLFYRPAPKDCVSCHGSRT